MLHKEDLVIEDTVTTQGCIISINHHKQLVSQWIMTSVGLHNTDKVQSSVFVDMGKVTH